MSAFTIGDGNGRFLIKSTRVQDNDLLTAKPTLVKMWIKRETAQKTLAKLVELESNKNWFYYGKAQPSSWKVIEVRLTEI